MRNSKIINKFINELCFYEQIMVFIALITLICTIIGVIISIFNVSNEIAESKKEKFKKSNDIQCIQQDFEPECIK